MTHADDAERLRRRETLETTAWVVVCGFAGWAAAAFLLNLNFLLSGCAFAAAGAAAGRRLNAGWPGVLGFVVTFLVGNSVAFLPVMATQAMSGEESVSQLASFGAYSLASGYGIAAALGFIPVLRWSVKSYAIIVTGFALGGAMSGLLLGVAIGSGTGFLGALALGVPLASGGFAAAEAVSRGPTWGAHTAHRIRPAWLAGWRAMALVALAGILTAGGAYALREVRKAEGRRRMDVRRTSGALSEEVAVYKALARLKDMPATTESGPTPEREALEIYVAVRYRARLKDTRFNPELQAIAVDLVRRHADKTDEDLGKAALKLGVDYLEELNSPRLSPPGR